MRSHLTARSCRMDYLNERNNQKMQQYFQVNIEYKSKERRVLNALLALVTGVLTLTYPAFLYLIAGGYLIALGLVFMYARTPAIIAAIPMITGILIFILISYRLHLPCFSVFSD